MRCYIWGSNNHENRDFSGRGVSCFAIPDWGLQFRAAQDGNSSTCEVAALLGLLRFIENNPKVFESERIEILTDASQLVEQLAGNLPIEPGLLSPFTQIRKIREKIRFELNWIPSEQNRAIAGVLELPPLKTKFQIQHTTAPKKPVVPPSRSFNS
jgi:hypothetical protein